jgi:hypothetical protein
LWHWRLGLRGGEKEGEGEHRPRALLRRFAEVALFGGLPVPHFGIEPIAAEEFEVAAAFDKAALIEHEDAVRIGNG